MEMTSWLRGLQSRSLASIGPAVVSPPIIPLSQTNPLTRFYLNPSQASLSRSISLPLSLSLSSMDLAPRSLEITIVSAEDLKFKGRDVYLVASLSGDESNEKQSTPVGKKGSTDPWLGHTFKFIVRDVDARVEFKLVKKKTFGSKKVVGEVDVPVMDLVALVVDQLADGCVGDMMKPKVLRCEVRSSSPKTKEETVAVLEFSCKFGERLSVEETVKAHPAAAGPSAYQQNAAPAGYWPAAPPPPPQLPGQNFAGRVVAEVAGNVIMDGINNLGFDGGDTDA